MAKINRNPNNLQNHQWYEKMSSYFFLYLTPNLLNSKSLRRITLGKKRTGMFEHGKGSMILAEMPPQKKRAFNIFEYKENLENSVLENKTKNTETQSTKNANENSKATITLSKTDYLERSKAQLIQLSESNINTA